MATEKAKIIRNKIKYDTRTIALSAILIAAALVLSLVESWIPIMVSIPGIRLGLANIATVFAIYVLGPVPSVVVVVLRCLLGAIFSGTFSAFAFSLCGGLFAFLAMWVLSMNRHISPIGVCVGGAAAHSIGQILAAMLVLGSKAPIAYLPVLMLISVVTGLITGVISELVLCALSNTTVTEKKKESPVPEQLAEDEQVHDDNDKAAEHKDLELERILHSELFDEEQETEDEENEIKDTSELIPKGETFEEIMDRLKRAKSEKEDSSSNKPATEKTDESDIEENSNET